MMKRFGSAVSVMALLASTTGPAAADTLREAMTKAYQTNPTLAGARAGQRANDENVPINRARGLPDVDLSGGYTENIKPASNSFTSPDRFIAGQANLSVPVYLGGSVKNSVKAAAARVRAGQDGLRGTESDVFTAVVAAYMDVIRDEAIVGLNMSQVRVLQTNLEATQDRFQVGDLTRTDIAQSEARLALAQSQLQSAEAQLISSRERYVQVVGNEPGALAQPPELPGLPESVDVAVTKALTDNPDLLGAQKSADAARIDIKTARASRLPQVRLFAQDSYQNFLNTLGSTTTANISQTQNAVSAGVQVAVPLYQGGGPSAQVRQAQARSGQAQEGVIEVERGVIAQTRSAYASWRASLAVIQSSEKAVAANRLSLEGVKAENSVGTRSILDILNAEQELLNSQVQLVSARRNAYVAGFALLAAMGDAEARDLGLDGGILYDPTVNYKRVKGKLFDWDDDPKPKPVSTRTVDTTPQNPSVSSQ